MCSIDLGTRPADLQGYTIRRDFPVLTDKIQPQSDGKVPWRFVGSTAMLTFRKARRLTEGDPTDHALATIASILDQPASPPEAAKADVGETRPAPQESGVDG